MCGICGIFGLSDKKLIKKMNDKLERRGPDDEGYYIDESVSLGMRRLSIIDLEGGHQPIFNEQGNLCVICNGEIYNYKELRKELEEKGHEFSTNSDTEVIVHAYEEYEENCTSHLEGMFAFAIYDSNKNELFLARDRLGIKPLFYTKLDNLVIFASEIKALFQYDRIPRRIDEQTLYEKYLFGYSILDSTLFEGIKSLLPGHYLVISKDKFELKRYYNYSIKPKEMSEKEAIDKLYRLLEESVKKMLMSDVGFGVLLSGGIDSSIITAIASKLSDKPVKTFTIGSSGDKDFEHAKIVSKHLATEHHEITPTPKEWHNGLAKYVFALEDTEPSSIGPLLLAKGTKKHCKMVLCGQASDELFGGYPKYKEISLQRQRMLDKWEKFKFVGKNNERAARTINYLNNFIFALKKENGFDSMLYYDLGSKLTNNQLAPVDRSSMAFGVEVRVPFLDTKLVNFVCNIPSNLKLKNNVEKYILRKIASNLHLPKIIQEREKYMPSMDQRRMPISQSLRNHKYWRFFQNPEQLLFIDIIEHFFIKNQAQIPKNFSVSDLR